MKSVSGKCVLTVFLVLTLTSILVPATARAQARDAAVVLDVRGEVVHQGGERAGRVVDLMDFLREGDTIVLTGDAWLVLNYFETGFREVVAGEGVLTVGPSDSRVDEGLKVDRDRVELTPLASSAALPGHTGAVVLRDLQMTEDEPKEAPTAESLPDPAARFEEYCGKYGDRTSIRPLRPVATTVETIRPVFWWSEVDGADGYEIAVTDENGRILMGKRVTGIGARYEGTVLATGRRYRWKVRAMSGGATVSEAEADFAVLSADLLKWKREAEKGIRQTAGSHAEAHIQTAVMAQRLGLFDKSAENLAKAMRDAPNRDRLKKRLAMLRLDCGR